jgi:hypothetical protein
LIKGKWRRQKTENNGVWDDRVPQRLTQLFLELIICEWTEIDIQKKFPESN